MFSNGTKLHQVSDGADVSRVCDILFRKFGIFNCERRSEIVSFKRNI